MTEAPAAPPTFLQIRQAPPQPQAPMQMPAQPPMPPQAPMQMPAQAPMQMQAQAPMQMQAPLQSMQAPVQAPPAAPQVRGLLSELLTKLTAPGATPKGAQWCGQELPRAMAALQTAQHQQGVLQDASSRLTTTAAVAEKAAKDLARGKRREQHDAGLKAAAATRDAQENA